MSAWIPVEERLPALGQEVWFVSEGVAMFGLFGFGLGCENMFFRQGPRQNSYHKSAVSHWMPVTYPAPPVPILTKEEALRLAIDVLGRLGMGDGYPGGFKSCPFCNATVGFSHEEDCCVARALPRLRAALSAP